MKTYLDTLKAGSQKTAGFLFFYGVLSAAVSACVVLTQHFTGRLSQAAVDFDADILIGFLGIMAAITALQAVSAAGAALLSGRFSAKTGYKFRRRFARHFTRVKLLQDAPEPGDSAFSSGKNLSVYTNDLPRAVTFVSESMPGLFNDILYIIIVFAYMIVIQPFYTLVYFALFPLLIFMQSAIAGPIQKKAVVMSGERQKFNEVVNDSLQNIPSVVAYSLEQTMENRYLSAYDRFFEASKSYLRSLILLVMSGMVATILPVLFIFGASGFAVVNGGMSLSEFVAFTGVSSLAANWITMLSQQLQAVSMNSAGAQKFNEALSGEEENITGATMTPAEESDGETAIEFSNVTFSYGGDTKVLKDASFKIKKGSRVAIAGESGSGKSTVLKLLLGLYEPAGGKITVFGRDISALSVDALRSQIAYVPQDSFMFPETIAENLKTAGTNPSGQDLRRACESAGILDFIDKLPNGFNTVLAESAENISGGQRQRLAIARAYLQNAPIVLFDEATASLDPDTEAEVLKAFEKSTEGKTVIMAAHRAAAIEACDNVIHLTGEARERG